VGLCGICLGRFSLWILCDGMCFLQQLSLVKLLKCEVVSEIVVLAGKLALR
jgi:hypothetical protein